MPSYFHPPCRFDKSLFNYYLTWEQFYPYNDKRVRTVAKQSAGMVEANFSYFKIIDFLLNKIKSVTPNMVLLHYKVFVYLFKIASWWHLFKTLIKAQRFYKYPMLQYKNVEDIFYL